MDHLQREMDEEWQAGYDYHSELWASELAVMRQEGLAETAWEEEQAAARLAANPLLHLAWGLEGAAKAAVDKARWDADPIPF